jgi:hypothetical protein
MISYLRFYVSVLERSGDAERTMTIAQQKNFKLPFPKVFAG